MIILSHETGKVKNSYDCSQTKYPLDKNFLCKLTLYPFRASPSAEALNHCFAPYALNEAISLADCFQASKKS